MNPSVLARVFYVLLRTPIEAWLRWRFRVNIVRDDYSATLRPPYVVLANHVNFWDPFLVLIAFGPPIHFIAADGNFRSRVMRWFMNFAGTIPKAKAKVDLESIRTLQRAVARRRVVGIFPEGQRSWDGTTRPILPGTPKLVRLLRVPVVSVRLKGGYLSLPRWSRHIRRGVLELHVTTVLTREEIAGLNRHEITERIARSVEHNETRWQRESGHLFIHPRRAEDVEQALFYCPDCDSWDGIRSHQDTLSCIHCGRQSWIAPSGRLYALHTGDHAGGAGNGKSGGPLRRYRTPDTVDSWNFLQRAVLKERVGLLTSGTGSSHSLPIPVIVEEARYYTGHRSRVLTPHGRVHMKLTAHHLTITPLSGPADGQGARDRRNTERFAIPIAEITGIHVQYAHQLEFYRGRKLHVFRMLRPADSAYRMEETVLALQGNTLPKAL